MSFMMMVIKTCRDVGMRWWYVGWIDGSEVGSGWRRGHPRGTLGGRPSVREIDRRRSSVSCVLTVPSPQPPDPGAR